MGIAQKCLLVTLLPK